MFGLLVKAVTEFPSCSLSPPSHPLVPSPKAITVIHLKQWLVTSGDCVSPGEHLAMSAYDFGVKIGGKLLTSSGQRPEKLLKILQCIGKYPPAKTYPTQHHSHKLYSKIYRQLMQLSSISKKQPNQKMGGRSKCLQRRHTEGQKTL